MCIFGETLEKYYIAKGRRLFDGIEGLEIGILARSTCLNKSIGFGNKLGVWVLIY